MKTWHFIGLLIVGLLAALFILLPFGDATAVLFGWIAYPLKAIPRMTIDLPTVLIGGFAVVLFTLVLDRVARSWQRGQSLTPGIPTRIWKFRTTLAVVAILFLLFAAGITLIGTVHQLAWLGDSDRPLFGQALASDQSLIGHSLARRARLNTNLKSISIGLANHASAYNDHLPAGGTFASDGTMLQSWETQFLPFLGYSWAGIDLEKPWNDEANARYFKCVIREFINPAYRTPELEDRDGFGLSHFAANGRVMGGNRSMRLDEITDGTSNTLLVGEVNGNFKPWGHPVNWRDPAIGINRSPSQGFAGPNGADGALFLMADGSIRFVSERISPSTLRALSTPRGGDEVPNDVWEQR